MAGHGKRSPGRSGLPDGIARFPKPPRNTFYYARKEGLVIFEGEMQLQGQGGISLLNKVLDVAQDLKTTRIYTGAAFPFPISHKEPSEVYGAVNKEPLRDTLKKQGLKLMEGGHISGLNGLMLGFAEKRNIEGICLLATMPQYAKEDTRIYHGEDRKALFRGQTG
ncbi:MAG: PAC2 family protein [Candidatus Omnitrophica bacterium]|nr:PAC2 family protein [Candidatus Omnitrophota bacterium]